MHIGWCIDICPTTPKPSWHSHPKRNGMPEQGGLTKYQKQNGNDHQLTVAGRNVFLSNTIRISPSLSSNENVASEFLHPWQAIKDSSLAIQPPNVFNIIEGVQGAFTENNASWNILVQIFKKASDTNAISNIEQNKYLSNIIQCKRNEPSLCDLPQTMTEQTFSCLRMKSWAEKYNVYLNHKN